MTVQTASTHIGQGENQGDTARSRYTALETLRAPYLERARTNSALTLPSLIPRDSNAKGQKFDIPYQSLGARGVNTLSSKFTLTLLPPNQSPFRYEISDFALEQMTKQEGLRAEVETALARIERAVAGEIEAAQHRVSANEAFKQLLVAGNCCYWVKDDGTARVYRIDRYVVRRDPDGDVREVILAEEISRDDVPEAMRMELGITPESIEKPDTSGAISPFRLFTVLRRSEDNKRWEFHQEINDTYVADSDGTYPIDAPPIFPLRLRRIDGEHYGRSYVEECVGDLNSLDVLTRAIVQGSAAAARVLFLVKPNGTARLNTVAEAPNGAVRTGNAEDVTVLQLNKYADFRVALETRTLLTESLTQAFMLNTSVQRQAERVTAEEIRYLAQELEDNHGGEYSLLAQEFLTPLINRIIAVLTRRKMIPTLPNSAVKPVIVAGMQALGRARDLQALDALVGQAAQMYGPQVFQYFNIPDLLTRRAAALGVDAKGLLKSPDQIAKEQQQAQQAQMAHTVVDRATGPAVQGMAKAVMTPKDNSAEESAEQ